MKGTNVVEEFWIATGKGAVWIWASEGVMKLEGMIPSAFKIGLGWYLAASGVLTLLALACLMCGLAYGLGACDAMVKIIKRRLAQNGKGPL